MIAMKYYTSTTQFNFGIDLHARQMYVCVMDRTGKKLVHTNIKNNDFAFFLKLVAPYRHDPTVCAECMFGWYWLADACQDAGIHFVLAHALYLKASRLRLEWLAGGLTAQSFWTGTGRLIVSLES
jgi:hypothetical protein